MNFWRKTAPTRNGAERSRYFHQWKLKSSDGKQVLLSVAVKLDAGVKLDITVKNKHARCIYVRK